MARKTGAQLTEAYAGINKDPSRPTAVRRLRNLYYAAADTDPEAHQRGMQWYQVAHEAARKGGVDMGISTGQAAGVIAAMSPNMDWENANVDAFHHLGTAMEDQQFHHLLVQSIAHRNNKGKDVRSADFKGYLTEHGFSALSQASDRDVQKALRIAQGAPWEGLMPRSQSPKTHAFATNIADPHVDGLVTVDGRHADITVDAMRNWGAPRGIAGSPKAKSAPGRYVQYEDITRSAAHLVGVLPHELQAVVWEHGKTLERRGMPGRKKGDTRLGQSYQQRSEAFRQGQAMASETFGASMAQVRRWNSV